MIRINLLIVLLLCGCSDDYLYVHFQNIDKNYFASSFIDSPELENLSGEQAITVSWSFPPKWVKKEIFLVLTIRMWDNSEKIEKYFIKNKRGVKTFYFVHKNDKKQKILTYKIDIKNKEEKVLHIWEHQLWKSLINIDSLQF